MSIKRVVNGARRGDQFDWSGIAVEVTRVAVDGSWADLICQPRDGDPWRKRQPLPMPPEATLVFRPNRGVVRQAVADRFWSKVNKGSPEDCWEWVGGARNVAGYGVFSIDKAMRQAHRVAYELTVGPIPDGLTIDHRCPTKHCVNPAHMEVVTRGENGRRGNLERRVYIRATHCCRGHELSGDNVREGAHGPSCRACGALRGKARYSAEAAQQYAEMVIRDA